MNFQNYIGKPLGTVIDEICSAKIEDWKNSIEEVSLSDKNLILSNTRGPKIFILGAAETYEKRQASIGRVELAKELKLLFTELQEGRLSVQVEKYPLDDEKPKIITLRPLFWNREWRIDDVGGEASLTVWNKDGTQEEANYLLREIIHVASSERPAASPAVEAPAEPPIKKRRARGAATHDEPFLVRMETMVRSGDYDSPWNAAWHLVKVEKCVRGTALDDSKIKRLHKAYLEAGLPLEADQVQISTRSTQK